MTSAERAWVYCLKYEAIDKTGHRACMNHRHDEHILYYGRLLGWKVLLKTIRETQFTMLDYFYRTKEGETSLWGGLVADMQEQETENRKAQKHESIDQRFYEMAETLTDRMATDERGQGEGVGRESEI